MKDRPGKATAVVLLSGGLDSATAAAWACSRGERLAALSIDYGQRHRVELVAAREVAAGLGISDHIVMPINLAAFGGSPLVDQTMAVPKGRSDAAIASGIPSTYVPARNTVFLALALALAESRGASRLILGVNAVDYSGYPDCRPEFLEAFRQLANVATKAGLEGRRFDIVAPLVALSKADIIRTGLDLDVDYALTTSCYDPGPDGRPCNACDSCRIRAAGFAAVGVPDPRLSRFAAEAEDSGRADR